MIKRCNNEAAPVTGEKRLRFQTLQCFADRGARNAEPNGQIAFNQAVPRFVNSAVDRFEDQRVGVFILLFAQAHIALRHLPANYLLNRFKINPTILAAVLCPTPLLTMLPIGSLTLITHFIRRLCGCLTRSR